MNSTESVEVFLNSVDKKSLFNDKIVLEMLYPSLRNFPYIIHVDPY